MNKANVVFITGTGRCGTNILKDVLSEHSKVFALPFELRFLTDPDGIIDFYTTFSSIWSPFIADVKIRRLNKLLKDVSAISLFNYKDWELEKYFPNFTLNRINLIKELQDFTFKGTWVRNKEQNYQFFSGPKNQEQLKTIFTNYLQNVIIETLNEKNKSIFCTDDTFVFLYAKQILELFPNAKLIYMYREPRDTVISLSHQRWCPTDLNKTLYYYKSLINQWTMIRSNLLTSHYCEISLESLVGDPKLILSEICEFIGLEFESELIEKGNLNFTDSHQGRWLEELDELKAEWLTFELNDITRVLGHE